MQVCHYSCNTCIGNAKNCILCSSLSTRTGGSGSECKCLAGYFDVGLADCSSY